MSNSARFIILGSERGWGQSAGTCSVQISCGVADRLYLAPGRSLPSRAGRQRGPLPQGWQGRLSPFSNTDLGFLVKTEPWLLQAPEAAGHQLCPALRCVVGPACCSSARRLCWSGVYAAVGLVNALFGEFCSRR